MPDVAIDIIKQLGSLGLASRLRRISEQLMRDVTRLYGDEGVTFEARWFGMVHLLLERPGSSVTEVASALGLSHPAVNQMAASLTRHGLLRSRIDRHDGRRRLLYLTPRATRLANRLEPTWIAVRKATEQLVKEASPEFIKSLGRIEKALSEESMYDRVRRRSRSAGPVTIDGRQGE